MLVRKFEFSTSLHVTSEIYPEGQDDRNLFDSKLIMLKVIGHILYAHVVEISQI
jgi:hypothetical protein